VWVVGGNSPFRAWEHVGANWLLVVSGRFIDAGRMGRDRPTERTDTLMLEKGGWNQMPRCLRLRFFEA